MRILNRIRDAVRTWLLGGVKDMLHRASFRAESLEAIAKVSAERLEAIQLEQARLDRCLDAVLAARTEIASFREFVEKQAVTDQVNRIGWKDLQKQQYHDLLSTQQEMEQKVDRMLLLLEPKAARLQDRRPLVTDWDEVQRQNLQQFEESNDGKSIRR